MSEINALFNAIEERANRIDTHMIEIQKGLQAATALFAEVLKDWHAGGPLDAQEANEKYENWAGRWQEITGIEVPK